MKRLNNLYDTVISMQNLILADNKARKGKRKQKAIKRHDKQRGCNLIALHNLLDEQKFTTSDYSTFTVFEPKERIVYRLPYYPDRIVQHAIMNILEPVFTDMFTANSYSCIKGKGIHKAANDLKAALQDVPATKYCLKLDITKFYPSVNKDILKQLLRRKFKDIRLLSLLDNIIDSAEGLPIGNYLSQYLANFYLTGFDHWIKEIIGRKYQLKYFRYADDMVILSSSKAELHQILAHIKTYLADELKLTVKPNYQVFPVAARGIDFVGYVFYHTHTYLRKSIKQNMARRRFIPTSAASYYGWAKHCNSRHLLKKLKIHDCIQRLRNKGKRSGIYGGQIKNRESIKHTNRDNGIRVETKPIQGQLSLFTSNL